MVCFALLIAVLIVGTRTWVQGGMLIALANLNAKGRNHQYIVGLEHTLCGLKGCPSFFDYSCISFFFDVCPSLALAKANLNSSFFKVIF